MQQNFKIRFLFFSLLVQTILVSVVFAQDDDETTTADGQDKEPTTVEIKEEKTTESSKDDGTTTLRANEDKPTTAGSKDEESTNAPTAGEGKEEGAPTTPAFVSQAALEEWLIAKGVPEDLVA